MENGIKPSDLKIIERILKQEHSLFPRAIFIDYYKSIYQAYNGPNHFLNEKSLGYLKNEILMNPNNSYPRIVDLSGFHFLWRINTNVVNQGIMSFNDFANAHFETCSQINTNVNNWINYKSSIEKAFYNILDNLNILDNALIPKHLFKETFTVSHSDVYHKYYNPHYRLINPQLLDNKTKTKLLEL